MRSFDPAMQVLVNARAKLKCDLREGILRRQSEKTPARIDEMRAGRQLEDIVTKLTALRAWCPFLLDDFGTGYSSLFYLKT